MSPARPSVRTSRSRRRSSRTRRARRSRATGRQASPSTSARRGSSRCVLDEERPVVYYIHPREIDPHHPRSPMKPLAKFSAYVNLASTEPKVRQLLRDFPSTSFEGYLRDHPVS
ncbi:MAG: DUF3473 domain-containing protein [Myxococcales bacterium]|nr:DUF3473 domain-containing protein [Myxococcales bacterium]